MPVEKNVRKELIRLYYKFCDYVVETNPRYIDSDFSFEEFINWLDSIAGEVADAS